MSVAVVAEQLRRLARSTERKFAIVSDIFGVAENVPSVRLPNVLSPDSQNVILQNGAVERLKGRAKQLLDANGDQQVATDGNPVIKYHRHISTAGTEYLFCCTKAHIYLWNQSGGSYTLKFTCSSDCIHWSLASINGKVIATNWQDKVQVWDDSSAGSDFAPLGSASGLDLDGGTTYLTKAKYVTVFEGYVIFAYTQEGGTTYKDRLRHSSYNDETDYDESGTGDTGSIDFPGKDYIVGFGHFGKNKTDLAVFKSESHYHLWLTEAPEVFNTRSLNHKIGLLAPDALARDADGILYYLASDRSIRILGGPEISRPKDPTLKQIHPSYDDYASAHYVQEKAHILFSIPYGNAATGNNKVLCYQTKEKVWQEFDFAIRAFGHFSRQTTYTIDTIPYDSIDEIGWATIDTVEAISRYPLDIASDYSGHSWNLYGAETDAGNSYTGYCVLSTDLAEKQVLSEFKRINNARFIFEREASGTVTVSVKQDTASSFESVGSVDLTDITLPKFVFVDLPMDVRARHFLIKMSATNRFRFVGAIFSYEFDDDR